MNKIKISIDIFLTFNKICICLKILHLKKVINKLQKKYFLIDY